MLISSVNTEGCTIEVPLYASNTFTVLRFYTYQLSVFVHSSINALLAACSLSITSRVALVDYQRIRFHQQKCEKMENMLHPYSSFCYAWDEPCDPHRLVLEVPVGVFFPCAILIF